MAGPGFNSLGQKNTRLAALVADVDGRAPLNGGARQSYSASFSITAQGATLLDYYSVDVAGNSESVHSLVGVSLIAADAISGVAETLYRVNAGTWQVCSGSFSVTSDGVHLLDYRSRDRAGNSEATHSADVYVDPGSLTNLTDRFVTQVGVSRSLVAMVASIDRMEGRPGAAQVNTASEHKHPSAG
ncbi:MAG: hypothetical protein WD535_04500 [Thermaerobacterales bacterium]